MSLARISHQHLLRRAIAARLHGLLPALSSTHRKCACGELRSEVREDAGSHPPRDGVGEKCGLILLLNPPAEKPVLRDNYCGFTSKASYLWPPVDLLAQSGWLHGAFSLQVVDAVAQGLSPRQCLQALPDPRPRAVFMLSCAATFEDDAQFARRLRRTMPEAFLAVGLSAMVIDPTRYLERYRWIDAVLTDFTARGLLDALQGRATHPGLVTRELADPPPPGARISYPTPQHQLFPLARYALPIGWRGPFSTVLTSVGCAHSCTFCSGSSIRYRRRPLQEVLAELTAIWDLGVRNLFFVDYTFTTSERYVEQLCQAMQREGLRFSWTCFARVDHINEPLLATMKAAGCGLIQLGVESGDEQILRRYKKGFTVAQIRQAMAACRSQGLRTLAFFIIGLPGETESTVRRTIDLALELDPDLASFAMPTPDPGTAVLDQAIQDGQMDGQPRQVVSTVSPTIGSSQLSVEQIRLLRAEAIRRFYLRPSFLWRQVRALRSLQDVRDKAANAVSLLWRSR